MKLTLENLKKSILICNSLMVRDKEKDLGKSFRKSFFLITFVEWYQFLIAFKTINF